MRIVAGVPENRRWGILVVELYAGSGTHGIQVAKTLKQVVKVHEGHNFRERRSGPTGVDAPKKRPPIMLLSIDILNVESLGGQSLVVDARGLTPRTLAILKTKMPNMVVVLLASPPCTAYSKANTTGVRDLLGANALVQVVKDMHECLGAVCTVMENPAWPSLLPRRPIAGFLPATCEVNYCAHGGIFFKKTQLWSGPDPFSLVANKFKASLCKGKRKCQIMLWSEESQTWKHPSWTGTSLAERQAIPAPLSRAIGGAIGHYMNTVGMW
jgi:hypothetical protein